MKTLIDIYNNPGAALDSVYKIMGCLVDDGIGEDRKTNSNIEFYKHTKYFSERDLKKLDFRKQAVELRQNIVGIIESPRFKKYYMEMLYGAHPFVDQSSVILLDHFCAVVQENQEANSLCFAVFADDNPDMIYFAMSLTFEVEENGEWVEVLNIHINTSGHEERTQKLFNEMCLIYFGWKLSKI